MEFTDFEDVLINMDSKKTAGLLVVKANDGFSVIEVSHDTYSDLYIMDEHYNGQTIKLAIEKYKIEKEEK